MGWIWSDIAVEKQTFIEDFIINQSELTGMDVSMILKAFFELNVPWNTESKNPKLKVALLMAIPAIAKEERGKNKGVTWRTPPNILYFLAEAGVKWHELPNEVRKTFYKFIERDGAKFYHDELINNLFYR
jgi:hypothetical protein